MFGISRSTAPPFFIVPRNYVEAFAFGERDSPMSCAACGHSGVSTTSFGFDSFVVAINVFGTSFGAGFGVVPFA